MNGMLNLIEIKGKVVKNDVFKGFVIKETLMDYDFPLLLEASAPDGTSWLFKWCDTKIDPPPIERWVAFKISKPRMDSLKAGHTSLREALTLPESEFYIFDGSNLFEPLQIKESSPESLPMDYMPSDDVSIYGDLLRLQAKNEEKLTVRLHVFSEFEDKVPLSIISPLQSNFQQYMSWAAHTIDRGQEARIESSVKDWSEFNLTSVASGSFKMECVSNSDKAKSEKLSMACTLLGNISNGEYDNLDIIKQQIGDDGIHFASFFAQFVSRSKLSLSISWVSSSSSGGYLAIDKRRADNFLKMLDSYEQRGTYRVLTIKLTDEEAEPIRRSVNGIGGMQSLLRNLQSKLTQDNMITLTPDEIEKILRYGLNYGQGGFQDRLRGIARVLKHVGAAFQTY